MGSRYSVAGIFLVMILSVLLFLFSCSSPEPTQTAIPPPGPTQTTTPPPEPTVPASEEPVFKTPTTNLAYLASSNPAEVDNSNLPVTPTDEIHITGVAPDVDIAQYRLTVDGLVDRELSLTYDQLLTYPTVTRVVLLICPEFFADNAEWTGIPLTVLLDEAGIKPEATELYLHAIDGYTSFLSLDEVKDGVFLAYKVNGQVLPREHGYPLRLVLTGKYGGGWVKWLERIEVR